MSIVNAVSQLMKRIPPKWSYKPDEDCGSGFSQDDITAVGYDSDTKKQPNSPLEFQSYDGSGDGSWTYLKKVILGGPTYYSESTLVIETGDLVGGIGVGFNLTLTHIYDQYGTVTTTVWTGSMNNFDLQCKLADGKLVMSNDVTLTNSTDGAVNLS